MIQLHLNTKSQSTQRLHEVHKEQLIDKFFLCELCVFFDLFVVNIIFK